MFPLILKSNPFAALRIPAIAWFLLPLLLLGVSGIFAQDGPFGMGNATGTDNQPKLLIWLDASKLTSTDGTDITTWPDLSGNGNDFTAIAAQSPIMRTSTGPNNRHYLEFSKADNRMKLENLTFSEEGLSIFYVLKTSDAKYGVFSFAESDEDPRKILLEQYGGRTYLTIDGTEHETDIGSLSNDVWRYGGFVWEGATNPTYWHRSNGNGAPELTENGVLVGESNTGTGTAVIGHIQNLLDGGYDPDDAFEGGIAELIVYDGVVGKALLRMINTYFRNKYNVGGTSNWDKLQSPTPFREGLIGIGRDNASNSEHLHSKRDGLVLFSNPTGLSGAHAYVSGGHSGLANSVVSNDTPGDVEARWNRTWYIRKDGPSANSDIQIGFDFSDGIGGENPTSPSEYVLLRRTGQTGTMAVMPVQETFVVGGQVRFRLTGTQLVSGYYTLGSRNQVISSLDGSENRVWHAYTSGNWSDPLTWTLDGSAAPYYINPDGNIPAPGDIIHIGSGRVVNADMPTHAFEMELNGTLDLNTQPFHSYTTLRGNGLLRCAGSEGESNFPSGNTDEFADPVSGGRVEFYGSGFKQSQNFVVNKLILNLDNASDEVVIAADFTHNGRMDIERGTLRINDHTNSARHFVSHDDVWVGAQGRIFVSNTSTSTHHTWDFYADVINDGGQIRFTNRTPPVQAAYYTSGENQQRISAAFRSGERNQKFLANGQTWLSRLVINKGEDDTYVFSISAENAGDFHLMGRANISNGLDIGYTFESHAFFNNAFAFVNGTAEIGDNIFIPLNTSGNYNLNRTTTLWVNGGTVAKGAPEMVGSSNHLAVVVYGTVKVSSGEFYANCESGFTLRENGTVQVDGGYVQANQIRTSTLSEGHVGGLIINGGEVNLDGNRPGGSQGSYYILSLTFPGNVFRMTGGELRVAGPSSRGLIFINSNPELTSVSGGTVIAEVKNTGGNHKISSRAPFWDLEIVRTIGTGTNRPVNIWGGSSGTAGANGNIPNNLPLYIQNTLTIRGDNNSTLSMENNDLYIRGDLTIENGGVYNHGSNTTFFHGNAGTSLRLPTTAPLSFNHLVVDKTLDTRYAEIISANATRAFEVLGDFRLERGIFENNNRNVSLHGDAVIRSTVGSEQSTGTIFFEGSAAQVLESDNGIFHNLTLENTQGVSLTGGELRVRNTLRLETGNFHLGPHRLRIETENGSFHNSGTYDASRCITTDGSASAGGLQLASNYAGNYYYRMGVVEGGTVKYTPTYIRINENYDDSGFITVVPVNQDLKTVDAEGGNSYLDFFWRVSGEGFESTPLLSYQFTFDPADIIGDPDSLASGRVLNTDPYLREIDSLSVATDHVNLSNNTIWYNHPDHGYTMAGTGIPLADADYTAGNPERFIGRPKVYFSRSTEYGAAWDDSDNWNELSSFSSGDGPMEWHGTTVSAAGDFPKAGDIAYIGFNPGSGKPHVYHPSASGVEAARVTFTTMQNAEGTPQPRWYTSAQADLTVLRPTLIVTQTSDINRVNQLTGEGTLLLRGDVDLSVTDISDFLSRDSSIVMLQPNTETITFNGLPPEVPNLFVTSGEDGSNPATSRIGDNLEVRNQMEVVGNAQFYLNSGATGDLLIHGDLILDRYQAGTSNPRINFPNSGPGRKVEVKGNLYINGLGANISVLAPNTFPAATVHSFIVHKNIHQDAPASTGLDFYTSSGADYISLTLRGPGNHSFFNHAGNHPVLGRLTVDKGFDLNSSFSFDSYFEVNGPTNQAEKSVNLLNGLLTIDHPDIDITLASGGGNFVIPASAGLELNSGSLRIHSDGVGLLLAGRLEINDGLFEIGDTDGENNFLEYSSDGISELVVNGGTLAVGSQIRQGLTNTDGILKYTQTGGEVRVGINAAPEINRGVFEITNDGSRFDFTGGTLTLVRGINSPNVPSLFLDPSEFNVSGTGELIIGHADSPDNAEIKNIGIRTFIELTGLEINNDSGNDPVVKLYSTPLVLNDVLTIDGGATLECGIQNLTLHGDVFNDGLLDAQENLLTINHEVAGTIAGEGVFTLGDVSRIGGGSTAVDADLEVLGDFSLDGGDMTFSDHTIAVRGSATVDGTLNFSAGSTGLNLAGTSLQQLKRTAPGTSHIDILTTDNASGISMVPGAGHLFVIGSELRMKRGIFNLQGNLLELGVNADIVQVNAFGLGNMISTGGALTNYGVKKSIPANHTEDVVMPLGLDQYMPIRLNLSDDEEGFTSGTTLSTYVFRLMQPQHPIIVDDVEESPDPQINDLENVLQMYFTVEAENVIGAKMSMEFQYHDDYVAVLGESEEDYIGARVVDGSPAPSVFKFTDAVNSATNRIVFDFDGVTEAGISGDYFAGIDYAIPTNVPVFTTVRDGDVNEGEAITGVYDIAVPGGGAPNGAVVHIQGEDELTLNIDGVNFYKTIIDANAVLHIDETSMHRIGIVEGTGTIRVRNTPNLPTATYNDFFTCGGGQLEYDGNTHYTVLGNIPVVRRVTFTGSGRRYLANNDVLVCEDLVVQGPEVRAENTARVNVQGDVEVFAGTLDIMQANLDVTGDFDLHGGTFKAGNTGLRSFFSDINITGGSFNVGTGGEVRLQGDLNKSGGSFHGGSGQSKFVFNGAEPQAVNGPIHETDFFYRMDISNAAGLTLNDDVDVRNRLILTEGLIHTGADGVIHLTAQNVQIENGQTGELTGGHPESFIDGPMRWTLSGNAIKCTFPVGKEDRFRPLALSHKSAARTWSVEYFKTSPMEAPEVNSLLPENPFEVKEVSRQEYWKVNSNSAASTIARVGLSWGDSSGVMPDPVHYQKLVVMEYNPTADHWINREAGSFNYNDVMDIGTFSATVNSTFTERIFTLGSEDPINPLPVTWLYFEGETANRAHHLYWATASELNADRFVVERSVDGRLWTAVGEVPAAGNSNLRNDYSLVDEHAPEGRVYYRLLQYDFDGGANSAPEIVSLFLSTGQPGEFDFLLYPNPATDHFNIRIEDFQGENVVVSISDLRGSRLLTQFAQIAPNGLSAPISIQLKPGVYVVHVVSNDRVKAKPLVVH